MRSNIVVATLLTSLVLPSIASAQQSPGPDLSGTWVINEIMSESMREKVRELMNEEITNPRTRARWDRVQARERTGMQSAPFARLEIAHEEPSVAIRYGGGRTRDLFTDGRELEPDPEYGVEALTVAWEGARLIVDSDTTRGRVTEFWELSDDGKRLFVTTTAEMGERLSGPVTFRRVYDLEPPWQEPAPEVPEDGSEDGSPEPAAEDPDSGG